MPIAYIELVTYYSFVLGSSYWYVKQAQAAILLRHGTQNDKKFSEKSKQTCFGWHLQKLVKKTAAVMLKIDYDLCESKRKTN